MRIIGYDTVKPGDQLMLQLATHALSLPRTQGKSFMSHG